MEWLNKMKYLVLCLVVLLSACVQKSDDIRDTHYVVRKEKTICTPVEVKDRDVRGGVYKDITYKCIFIRTDSEDASDYNAKKRLEKLVKEDQNEQTSLQPN